MTKLASQTVGAGGTSSITFSNIPQGYTDLVVKASARSTRSANLSDGLCVYINGLTTGYTYKGTQADGTSYYNTSTGYEQGWGGSIPGASTSANLFGNTEFYFVNYSGFNVKAFTIDSVSPNASSSVNYMSINSEIQSGSAPITSLTFFAANGTLVQYSTFSLYGVKNASKSAGNSIKGTGGNIMFDGTYVYHVFSASGVFTATQPVNAQVTSVGGGGGGGWNNAGGGGGGELDILSPVSLPAGASRTVTVGAGGAPGTTNNQSGFTGSTSSFGSDVTSLGGGGGGTGDGTGGSNNGQPGGSGGGASLTGSAGGAANGSNTFAGGATGYGAANNYAGAGGGGATSAGTVGGSAAGGNGGQGYRIATFDPNLNLGNITYLGSGGGGGCYYTGPASQGIGGPNAGNGAREASNGNLNPGAGDANGGGGGGGGAYTGVNSRAGASGGSGVVIVRYKG